MGFVGRSSSEEEEVSGHGATQVQVNVFESRFSWRCGGFWVSVCLVDTCCARWMSLTGAACYTSMNELSLRPWRQRWPAHTGTTERLYAASDSAVRTLHQTIKAFTWTVTQAFIVSWQKEAINGSVKGAFTRQWATDYLNTPEYQNAYNNCTIIKVWFEMITHKK